MFNNELPRELDSFVDRRMDVTAGNNLLGSARLVTLMGIGGVGKSRLALRIAERSCTGFPDGVCFIELADLRDGALLGEVFANSLGLYVQRARSPLDVVAEYLQPRRILIVVDNCEQIITDVAAVVDTLLRKCPDLRILATSREAMNIAGEVRRNISPLPVPEILESARGPHDSASDSVTLFAHRAAAVVPDFEITEDNYPTVASICGVLEGIPLAIELAAARVSCMSLTQLMDRLSARYEVLTQGSRSAPRRQQSLRSTIEWSYDLCTPVEQSLWAHMSVFSASFELDAAEGVLKGYPASTDVLDVVSSLVDKSILLREESGSAVRFRMLDTIREYGREKLGEAGEDSLWCHRHRDWYLNLAIRMNERWLSEQQFDFIARIGRELPNLREALAYTLSEGNGSGGTLLRFVNALYRFWLARGMTSEGRRWVERTLDRVQEDQVDKSEHAAALFSHTAWCCMQGDYDSACMSVERLRALDASEADSIWVHAYATKSAGLYFLFRGEVARARAMLEDSLVAMEATGDLCSKVEVLLPLGWARALCTEPTSALSCFTEATFITATRNERMFRSHSLLGAGISLWVQGQSDAAEESLQQSVQLARSRSDPFIISVCLETMAWIAGREGDMVRAATLLEAAAGIVRVAGSTATSVLFPTLDPYHEQCLDAIRREFSEDRLADMRRNAGAFDLTEAAAYALREDRIKRDTPAAEYLPELTIREREIAALVAEGLTNKEIASRLVVSRRTVDGHVEHILSKLDFTSRTQIAAWVVQRNSAAN